MANIKKMIKYLKKIFYKKKLAGITICFLSVIFLMPISNASALGEITDRHIEFHDKFFEYRPDFNYIYEQQYENALYYAINNNLTDYVIIPRSFNSVFLFILKNQHPLNLGNDLSIDLGFRWYNSNNKEFYFVVKDKNDSPHFKVDYYIFENNSFSKYSSEVLVGQPFNSNSHLFPQSKTNYNDYSVNDNLNFPIYCEGNCNIYFWGRPNYSPYYFESIKYKDVVYNWEDNLDFLLNNDEEDDDYIPQRKLYNFQIDLKNQSHLEYTHSFKIDYNAYNRPFENLLKGFEFVGLVNDNGLYHWEKTDSCYINNNDYQLLSSDERFRIDIANINGDCLDYYDRVKLIVKLNNATLKLDYNLSIDTNSSIYYNFLSDSSVVDVFSNYKYVNFTTDKNNVNFDLFVKESSDGKFENRHFFKYFDKNELKTTDEYVNNHIGPYPVYNNMYKLHNVVLNKDKGLTVFKMNKMNNEVFTFEYNDIYYSLTDNDFNKNVKIVDEEGTPQVVDIDVEYPDPPSENIINVNVGVSSLKDGISVVHTLYSTFYNNLTVEFKILHNLFFTLLIISIVIKVVLKWLKLLIISVKL